jgi:hypothetical protein
LIKRSGVFSCKACWCRVFPIPGVDFQDVYQAVADDETFRIMLILMMLKVTHFLIFDVELHFSMANLMFPSTWTVQKGWMQSLMNTYCWSKPFMG